MTIRARHMLALAFGIAGLGGLVGMDGVYWAAPPAAAEARDSGAVTAFVDQEIRTRLAKEKVPASPECDDAEFLRRVSLDLTGKIPTPRSAAEFLDSADAKKRSKLIDELLASPEFGSHIAQQWTKRILAAGVPGPNMTGAKFQTWMADKINKGSGWDKIVQEILTAKGPSASTPTTFFFDVNLDDGKLSPAMLTGSTTQLFLGMQVQCAECHDHPFTKWTQSDFWGLASFYGRTTRSGNAKKGGPSGIDESVAAADPQAKNKKAKQKGQGAVARGKQDAAGLPTIVIPSSGGNKGSGKVVSAKFLYGEIPASLRKAADEPLRPFLASWVTSKDNPAFARNTANWAWAHLFGRGFIHPIDDFQDEIVPSHPAVLDRLSKEFVQSQFDMRHLFRVLCNSATYQRSSRTLPGNKDDDELFSHVKGKTIGAEVFHDMIVQALAVKNLKPGVPFFSTLNKDGSKSKNAKQLPQSPPRDQFVRSFTTEKNPDQQTEFTHGIPQMLRLLNAMEWKEPIPRIDAAVRAGSPEKGIEHLYLATLSRRPQAEERKLMVDYVLRRPTLEEGYKGALWILINSSEFQLNH